MSFLDANIHPSWNPFFETWDLSVDHYYAGGGPKVFPPRDQIFRVFRMPLESIRVVFLGQDPYHGPGQAHGLAFSVQQGISKPPSLVNIFKELQTEFPERGYVWGPSGYLEAWENQGIFLLNTALTVEAHKANSHAEDWRDFTDDLLEFIAANNPSCVFLLLGGNAKSKKKFILAGAGDAAISRIVEGVHPSPLSAYNGFFGSGIFKQVESRLGAQINWATS